MASQTMAAQSPTSRSVIQRKLLVPRLGERIVVRPRLENLLAELIECHGVVAVSATAGAGKTTAVVRATRALGRPLVWLTVDRTDVAPGRLVTYIEAALARQLPTVDGVATTAMTIPVAHPEAVGLLAEAVGDEEVVFVIDELERLSDAEGAWAVIEALVRYAPPSMRLVLLSRRELPPAISAITEHGTIAALGERELAFTPDEAAEALEQLGNTEIDPVAAVEATGGWVTGILFEAWRSAEHVPGAAGEADPLNGYLSSHILGQLAEEDREFLVTTSLLDEVTAGRAEQLGLANAGERLVALRAAHLPVTWEPGVHAMRCHARFREYLLERLARRGPDAMRALRLAHGLMLAREGHDEEATEELLRAGALIEARETAERAIMAVIERLDAAIAERWLAELGSVSAVGSNQLTTAELMLAITRDDYARGVRIVDGLAEAGERELLAKASSQAAALMAWCYFHAGRLDDLRAVLAVAESGPAIEAVRYAARLVADTPGEAAPTLPELSGGPLDALAMRARYQFGHLSGLDAEPTSRWVDAATEPWRIAVLRATGHTQRALELYSAARSAGASAVGLHAYIGPEVLVDAGRRGQAREALARGRTLARESGSVLMELLNLLVELEMAVRVERDAAAARAAFARIEQLPAARDFPYLRERLDALRGLMLLHEGQDDEAVIRLRSAVSSMVTADRLLMLPAAAVYLAEAEWRAADEEAADHAADVALEAASRQGSNHLLLQALAAFPAVASRRIDAEPGSDSRWHDIGRALKAQGVPLQAEASVHIDLREFGQAAITLNGEEVRPRIAKSYEVLAYLAVSPDHSAQRSELLDALFDGRADDAAGAYLRQAINQLRQVLPAGASLIVERGAVQLGDGTMVQTESRELEARFAEAARMQGQERLDAVRAALTIVDRGEYLPRCRSGWVSDRRERLAELATDARQDAADLAFATGRYVEAEQLAKQVIDAQPYREAAWSLMMRIANARGDQDGVLTAYHRCAEALRDLQTAPTKTTKRLLDQLRR
jgi:DNA-binding SARP family transcriptional activator